MTWNLYLQAFLWSYLSLKANGVVIRCLDQILQAETEVSCDFRKSYSNTRSTTPSNFKRRTFSSDESDFKALWKFSVAAHDMKFVFASFLMIMSITQSKRSGHMTFRSISKRGNASKRRFFRKLYSNTTSTPPSDFKKRASQSGDGDFKALQKIVCSFPWHEICVCKLPHDQIYLSKQTGWSYDA